MDTKRSGNDLMLYDHALAPDEYPNLSHHPTHEETVSHLGDLLDSILKDE